jgi:hypothetical protein
MSTTFDPARIRMQPLRQTAVPPSTSFEPEPYRSTPMNPVTFNMPAAQANTHGWVTFT